MVTQAAVVASSSPSVAPDHVHDHDHDRDPYTLRVGFDFGGGYQRRAANAFGDGAELSQIGTVFSADAGGMHGELGRWQRRGMYFPLIGIYPFYAWGNEPIRPLGQGRTLEATANPLVGARLALPGVGERVDLGDSGWLELAIFPSLALAEYGVSEIAPGTFHNAYSTQESTAAAFSASVDTRVAWCSKTSKKQWLGACLRVEPILVNLPVHGPVIPLEGARAYFSVEFNFL